MVAGTSCCNEHMSLKITDVAGNIAKETVRSDNYGSGGPGGLSKEAFWGIIGGAIALVLIVAIVITVVCCNKDYCKNCCGGYEATGH